MAVLLNFNVLLPKRNEDLVIVPPPAFYFLPYYIEQKVGWSNAWGAFDYLSQFSQWQKEIIPYHIGITDIDYYNKIKEIYEIKREKADVNSEIERLDSAISVVNEFVPKVVSTLDIDELDKIKDELREDVFNLHQIQEKLFEDLADLRAQKAFTESQLSITMEAIKELEKDYKYALNEDDEIQCPTCGVIHDNSLVSKFAILSDKDQAEQKVERLSSDYDKINKKIIKKEEELFDTRKKIQILNDKYYREEKDAIFTLQNVLENVAAHSVKIKVENHMKIKTEEYYHLQKKESKLNSELKESIKNKRNQINCKFQELYPKYITLLQAEGVVSSKIKSPEHYKKVANSGGAAEGVRGMLAYYVAVYNLIYVYSEEVLGPLVVDTPNQHEQAKHHYERIVSFIQENTPKDSQIFLCAMQSPQLEPIQKEETTKTFILENERALLNGNKYEEIREKTGWIFEVNENMSRI